MKIIYIRVLLQQSSECEIPYVFLKFLITYIYFLPILQFVAFSGAMFSDHMNITLLSAAIFISKRRCANQNVSNKRRTRQGTSRCLNRPHARDNPHRRFCMFFLIFRESLYEYMIVTPQFDAISKYNALVQ
jgi:hypothetical protein